MTRLFLVAGEASGDLHGSLLARALREIDPQIQIEGVGGAEMERAGVTLIERCEEMGVTGLWEVVKHLPRFMRLLDSLTSHLRSNRPDALIPIDYPDFNIRLAARAHSAGVPVIYYISPQVWAWRRGRVGQLARTVRRMIVIFPFEEDIYREEGVPVTYVGHPLVDQVEPSRSREELRRDLEIGEKQRLIALLPGSRKSEVQRILPTFLKTRELLSERDDIRWIVALAPGLDPDLLHTEALDSGAIEVRTGETYDLLSAADLALTASGTATLEAALLGTPMIVVYRMHPATWHLARRLVRIEHVAMANLLAGRRLVPEFLQDEAEPKVLADTIVEWIDDSARLKSVSDELKGVAAKLGSGSAPTRAAQAILSEIRP